MEHPLCPDPNYPNYDPIQQNCFSNQTIATPTTAKSDTSPVPDLLFGGAIIIALAGMFLKRKP